MQMRFIGWASAALLLVAGPGCSGDDDEPGASGPVAGNDGSGFGNAGGSSGGSGDGSGGGGGDAQGAGASGGDSTDPTGTSDGGLAIPDELRLCNGELCECADGIDNDGDGTIDGFDVECTGPGDDDEGSFATGISGDNRDPFWQDCFFDGNSGAGDDDCRYHTECLTGEREASDRSCTVTQECVDFCGALTPNGCDCFGCCAITREDGSEIHVVIGATCDEDDLSACQTCTPSEQCGNECGECELCPGRTVDDLPASCSQQPPGDGGSGSGGEGGSGGSGEAGSGGSGTPVTCDNGATVCETQGDCPSGYYCSWACCTLIPPD